MVRVVTDCALATERVLQDRISGDWSKVLGSQFHLLQYCYAVPRLIEFNFMAGSLTA